MAKIIRCDASDRDAFDAGSLAVGEGDGVAGQIQPRREEGEEGGVGGAIYWRGAQASAELAFFNGKRVTVGARRDANSEAQHAVRGANRDSRNQVGAFVIFFVSPLWRLLYHVGGIACRIKAWSVPSAHQAKINAIVALRSNILALMRGSTR